MVRVVVHGHPLLLYITITYNYKLVVYAPAERSDTFYFTPISTLFSRPSPQPYYQLIIIQMFIDDICISFFLWRQEAKTTALPLGTSPNLH
jgi:hypothetical protein